MHNAIMQPAIEPFMRLIQGNVALLTEFYTSPAAMRAMVNAFQHDQGAATSLAQTNAFGELMQGLLKNYTNFMTELGQTSMTLWMGMVPSPGVLR